MSHSNSISVIIYLVSAPERCVCIEYKTQDIERSRGQILNIIIDQSISPSVAGEEEL